MNNLYVIANRKLNEFRKADGTWTSDIEDAEQMEIHAALEKEAEIFEGGDKMTELVEVPLMHDAQYEDALSLTDVAGDFFDRHGIDLEVEIGSGDETKWTLRSRASGETAVITLADCTSFEVSDED